MKMAQNNKMFPIESKIIMSAVIKLKNVPFVFFLKISEPCNFKLFSDINRIIILLLSTENNKHSKAEYEVKQMHNSVSNMMEITNIIPSDIGFSESFM